ncbi:cytosine permease [Lactococcus formosensis]|uniref:cytosine permease n=1 Tax=Lactococcus formosensis TaxID=1281486 RepID=UPI0022E1F344|nr:cytosine permease [Lactococcus formosensis]
MMEISATATAVKNEQAIDFSSVSEELRPKSQEERDWGIRQFTTLWMGPVHNILSYMTVAGFFLLGLNSKQVFAAVMVSAIIVSFFYVVNGVASAKYGIPFTMVLRSVFGTKGSIFPALARGLIAGVVFTGTQTTVTAGAMDVIFNRIFPGYTSIGGGARIFGLPVYTALSLVLVWLVTVLLFMGGNSVIDKLGTYASPVVYLFIIGAAVWAITIAGGFNNVMNYAPEHHQFNTLLFITCVSALVSNWAGPIVNTGDFTSRAQSMKAMAIGLPLGFILSYVLFAITCVSLFAGTAIAFPELKNFDIVQSINQMDSTLAVIVLIMALNIGAVAFVVFGNLFPAGLQLTSLAPKIFTVKRGGLLTAVVGILIMPWNIINHLFLFYSFIGSMFGPITGIMLSDFFINKRGVMNLKEIYAESDSIQSVNYNKRAMWVLAVSFVLSMIGAFVPQIGLLKAMDDFAFFTGLISSFVIYTAVTLWSARKK